MEDTSLWQIPAPDSEHGRNRRAARGDRQRLQRRTSQSRKIKREDLVNVLGRAEPMASVPDLFEDETIPGKAIVLKMPENSMKTYFVPLPADLDVLSSTAMLKIGLKTPCDRIIQSCRRTRHLFPSRVRTFRIWDYPYKPKSTTTQR